jgi:Flp pilus assembly protein TadB
VPLVDQFPDSLADASRRTGSGIGWSRRRNRAQRVLVLVGLVVLAAMVSSTVRDALVGLAVAALGLVLLLGLVAALMARLVGRFFRRHPLADLAVGYLIGRRRERRYLGQYRRGYPPSRSSY